MKIKFLFISIIFSQFFFSSTVIAKVADSILVNNIDSNENLTTNLKRYASCYDINWATWSNFTGKSSTGTINNGSEVINVTMNANYDFSSTPGIYNHAKFSTYPSPIPNTTVPQTTWSVGNGGTTTMCFSKTVSNPVLLIASLGNSAGLRATLKFSLPYVVLFDGGKMTFDNSTSITGEEGFAIIMFPGDFTCVTINSTTPEFYTNITWGIKPSPFIVDITEDPSSCGIAKLTASGGIEYKWDGGDTPNSATNTFRQSGTYIVTVKDVNGCSASVSKKIDLSPFNPSISGNTASCEPVTLTASGGTSYFWDGGDTPNNATNTFQTSGRYTVTVRNQQGCVSTLFRDITINPITTNNVISTPLTFFCNREATIAITGSTPQGASSSEISYKWEQSDDEQNWATIGNETGKDISAIKISKTQYFKRTTLVNSCFAYSNILKVVFQSTVNQALAGNDQLMCNSNRTTLDANPPAINETGTWQVVSPTNYSPFDASNLNDPKAQIMNIPADIDVVLKWTINQDICQTSSSSTLTIHNYSEAILTLPRNLTINEGQSVQIPATITPVVNNYTYTWSPDTGLDNAYILAPIAKPDKTIIYHLKITYGNNCIIEKDIRIGVDKTTKLAICSGETVQLTGEAFIGTSPGIQWQFFDSGAWVNIQNANNADFSLKTIEHFENTPMVILYRRMVTTGGTTYFDSKYEITTNPHTQNNTISTETLNYCGNTTEHLSITGSDPVGAAGTAINYAWELSNDGANWSIIVNETAKDIMLNSLTRTAYFRRTTYSNSCPALSNALKISLNPSPTIANAGENLNLCGKSSVVLNGNKPGENEVGTWSVVSPVNFNPFTTAGINDPNAVINNLPSDQQVVLQWEITNNNCNTTTKDEVEIISYRDIAVTAPTKLTIDYGKVVNLNVFTDLRNEPYSFEWLPKTGLKNPYSLSPDASPRENTTYTLKINYGFNCSKIIPIEVIVLNTIEIPKSFSPNGDGINDNWNIGNILNYPGSKISVYNRYGTPMYQNASNLAAWDGTYKGNLLPVGVYYYVIELKDKYNSVYNGSITVIR
jgi:gliding motility-associated-like protein